MNLTPSSSGNTEAIKDGLKKWKSRNQTYCSDARNKHARVQVFELCRFLADVARDQVLATPQERRVSVPPELIQVLQLEEWRHPDVVNDIRPSGVETFQQLAQVLATGDMSLYRPSLPPNTHWRNWPEGGAL